MSMKIAPKPPGALPSLTGSTQPATAAPTKAKPEVEVGPAPQRTWNKDTFEAAPRGKGGKKGLKPRRRSGAKPRPSPGPVQAQTSGSSGSTQQVGRPKPPLAPRPPRPSEPPPGPVQEQAPKPDSKGFNARQAGRESPGFGF